MDSSKMTTNPFKSNTPKNNSQKNNSQKNNSQKNNSQKNNSPTIHIIDNSVFFEKNRLDEFRNNPKIKTFLKGKVLLNREEIIQYIQFIPQSYIDNYKITEEEQTKIQTYQYENFIENTFCNSNSMNERYMLENKSEGIMNKLYDIILLIKTDYIKLETLKNNIISNIHYNADRNILLQNVNENIFFEKKMNIKGFLVVEKGECDIYPNAYSLKLICSEIGSPLIGAYLCMIKKMNEISKIGLLELADSYNNIKGLCAYNKFGFTPNHSLAECYQKCDNCLPMSVYLGDGKDELFKELYDGKKFKEYTVDDIINTVIGIKNKNFNSIDLCSHLAVKFKDYGFKDARKYHDLLTVQKQIIAYYAKIGFIKRTKNLSIDQENEIKKYEELINEEIGYFNRMKGVTEKDKKIMNTIIHFFRSSVGRLSSMTRRKKGGKYRNTYKIK